MNLSLSLSIYLSISISLSLYIYIYIHTHAGAGMEAAEKKLHRNPPGFKTAEDADARAGWERFCSSSCLFYFGCFFFV